MKFTLPLLLLTLPSVLAVNLVLSVTKTDVASGAPGHRTQKQAGRITDAQATLIRNNISSWSGGRFTASQGSRAPVLTIQGRASSNQANGMIEEMQRIINQNVRRRKRRSARFDVEYDVEAEAEVEC